MRDSALKDSLRLAVKQHFPAASPLKVEVFLDETCQIIRRERQLLGHTDGAKPGPWRQENEWVGEPGEPSGIDKPD